MHAVVEVFVKLDVVALGVLGVAVLVALPVLVRLVADAVAWGLEDVVVEVAVGARPAGEPEAGVSVAW